MSVEERRYALLKHTHDAASIGEQRPSIDVQTFTADGTWTKPDGARIVFVRVVGGGGGAGSGGVRALNNVNRGGGSGEGGFISERTYLASDLGSTESVVVGQGGLGGSAVGTAPSAGNGGTNGGTSNFAGVLSAQGGAAGGGGNGGAGGGGGHSNNAVYDATTLGGMAGATSNATGPASPSGEAWEQAFSSLVSVYMGCGGGGAGGGITNVNVLVTGGDGSSAEFSCGVQNVDATYRGLGGLAPTKGGNWGGTMGFGGGGGGGTAPSLTDNGVHGADGGFPGGGGGGGSAAVEGFISGFGGSGGNGVVVVLTYF
jgi:hypothetical protein